MFFRKIDKTPKSVVRHNKINFGTFNSTPQKIDISGIRGPFTGFPLPPFITDTRIKGMFEDCLIKMIDISYHILIIFTIILTNKIKYFCFEKS